MTTIIALVHHFSNLDKGNSLTLKQQVMILTIWCRCILDLTSQDGHHICHCGCFPEAGRTRPRQNIGKWLNIRSQVWNTKNLALLNLIWIRKTRCKHNNQSWGSLILCTMQMFRCITKVISIWFSSLYLTAASSLHYCKWLIIDQ